jgi:hypothetical protein
VADEKLIQAWRRWAAEHGVDGAALDDAEATVALILRLRRAMVDEKVRHWVGRDLYDIFFGLFPAGAPLHPDEAIVVTTHIVSFLTFLDATAQLDEGSDPLPRLIHVLDDIAEQLSDDDEPLVVRPPIRLSPDITLPTVRLAKDEELIDAVEAAPSIIRLRTFAEWVGARRTLTPRGNLTLADGKELVRVLGTDDLGPDGNRRVRSSRDLAAVDSTFDWAILSGLVIADGSRLLPVLSEEDAADPLGWYLNAFEARIAHGILEQQWTAPWSSAVEAIAVDVLVLAYLSGRVSLRTVRERASESAEMVVQDSVLEPIGGMDAVRDLLDDDVDRLVERLVALGVVTVSTDPINSDADTVDDDTTDAAVVLTPLGTWVTNQLLRIDGYDAPAIPDLSDAPADTLLRALIVLDAEQTVDEMAGWCATRTPEGIADLAAAIRDAGDEAVALLPGFFTALTCFGPEAEPQVRRLLEDPRLRPYGVAWLVDKEIEKVDALDQGDVPVLLLDQVAATLVIGGPTAVPEAMTAFGDHAAQLRVIDMVWRVDSPYTDEVLTSIADCHSSSVVAKAARKALFKRRSRHEP